MPKRCAGHGLQWRIRAHDPATHLAKRDVPHRARTLNSPWFAERAALALDHESPNLEENGGAGVRMRNFATAGGFGRARIMCDAKSGFRIPARGIGLAGTGEQHQEGIVGLLTGSKQLNGADTYSGYASIDHRKDNMPFILAGNGGGLKTGRHLKFPAGQRSSNDLLVSILNLFGDTRTTYGEPGFNHGALNLA